MLETQSIIIVKKLLLVSMLFCVLISIPVQTEASSVSNSSSSIWCRITSFFGFSFCDTDSVVIVNEVPTPDVTKSSTPLQLEVTERLEPKSSTSSEIVAIPTSPVRSPDIINKYITTNPTTIIREVVKETVRETAGGGTVDMSNFVTKDLFYGQTYLTQDSLNRRIRNSSSGDSSESVDTNELTVTGDGTVSGTFTTTGVLSSLASVSTPYFSATNPLATSTLLGALTVGTSTAHATFTLDGSAYLSRITPPSETADHLYNVAGDLYWAGNVIGGVSAGQWATDGTNAWRASGSVGIGTTTPSATLSLTGTAGSGNLFAFASSTGSNILTLDAKGALNFGTSTTRANIYINGGGTTTQSLLSYDNIAIGNEAFSNTAGTYDNIAIGYQALYGSSTVPMTGHDNNAIGWKALLSNTTGGYNNAMGTNVLRFNTTGSYNTAQGYYSLGSSDICVTHPMASCPAFHNEKGWQSDSVRSFETRVRLI